MAFLEELGILPSLDTSRSVGVIPPDGFGEDFRFFWDLEERDFDATDEEITMHASRRFEKRKAGRVIVSSYVFR
jgi:hypothetical protein